MSSKQVTLYGRKMSKSQAKCFASMGGVGYQHRGIIINDKDPFAPGLKNGTCARDFWGNFNETVNKKLIPQHVIMKIKGNFSICYNQEKGTVPVGNTTNCRQTWASGEGAPVYLGKASNGTWWVQGGWWLCGNNAYPVLPVNWTGVCAPIFVSDHTFFLEIKPKQQTTRNRGKRELPQVQPHDAVWGTDVPAEYKHWRTEQK